MSAVPEWLTKMVSYVRDNWSGSLPQPEQIIAGKLAEGVSSAKEQAVPVVADILRGSVNQIYPAIEEKAYNSVGALLEYIKKDIENWVKDWVEYGKAQVKSGLMIGAGIAVTGVTILIIYKIYDKYLRNEQTKEKTEDEIADEVYALASDELARPTHSSQLHMALKKDVLAPYLDDTNPIFAEAYDKAFKQIALDFKNLAKSDKEKFEKKKESDRKIDSAMNAIMQEIVSSKKVSIPSDEEKLKYIIEHYVENENKFDTFTYLIIGNIEMLTAQLLKGDIAAKDIKKTEKYIRAYKEELLKRLNAEKEGLLKISTSPEEQRAAYALYLQLKNKISVEKMLTPEQLKARNPFGPKIYYTKPAVPKEQTIQPSNIIPAKQPSLPVNDKGESNAQQKELARAALLKSSSMVPKKEHEGETLEQQIAPSPSNEVNPHERKDIPEEMQREVPLTSASSAGAA